VLDLRLVVDVLGLRGFEEGWIENLLFDVRVQP
jgi:hypothetical protein